MNLKMNAKNEFADTQYGVISIGEKNCKSQGMSFFVLLMIYKNASKLFFVTLCSFEHLSIEEMKHS